jgi:hypothetical protein
MELYTGSVSHARWSPKKHSFAYGLCMSLIDVDAVPDLFKGWWPIASTSGFSLLSFRESDHLKPGSGAPPRRIGSSLGDAVRDLIEAKTGSRPSPSARIRLLTHLSFFGYCFNPISLYFIEDKVKSSEKGENEDVLRSIVAEVSNTPWNEMHLYVLDKRVDGVEASVYTPSETSLPTDSAHDALIADGAVPPTEYSALVESFSEEKQKSIAGKNLRLNYKWNKTFHVSPFMEMAQKYDWTFTFPSETLLIQSRQTLSDNTLMFTTQLRLERTKKPVTRLTLLWMLFWAYPILTWRIQFWIHVEAIAVWAKGIALVPHPTGATNATVDAIHFIMKPFLWLQEKLKGKEENERAVT